MAFLVKYNGGTESFAGCSNPSALREDFLYEVVEVRQNKWYTNYTIKGIVGEFNSVWFDIIQNDTSRTIFFALTDQLPEIDEPLIGSVLIDGGFEPLRTSTMRSMEQIGISTYRIFTRNSEYIVYQPLTSLQEAFSKVASNLMGKPKFLQRQVYLAVANKKPLCGLQMSCKVMRGKHLEKVTIVPEDCVEQIGLATYKVITKDDMYIIHVR